MKINQTIIRRYLIFTILVVVLFSALFARLYSLQIVNADQYQESAETSSFKTIRVTGRRGMITDAESVVFAMSEDIYNVSFLVTNAEIQSDKRVKELTPAILKTIEIMKSYGIEMKHEFVIQRNPETDLWEFNFGKGISEKAWEIRETYWYGNHYLSKSRYPTAEDCYNFLYKRYFLDQVENLDEETARQVMAVYSEMRMNIFNSMPIIIAENIPFEAVQEISSLTMSLPGVGIDVGEKRVYPRHNVASQIIGYVGPIAERDNYATELKPMGYQLNDIIGKDGIERSMENWLTPNIASRAGSRDGKGQPGPLDPADELYPAHGRQQRQVDHHRQLPA